MVQESSAYVGVDALSYDPAIINSGEFETAAVYDASPSVSDSLEPARVGEPVMTKLPLSVPANAHVPLVGKSPIAMVPHAGAADAEPVPV